MTSALSVAIPARRTAGTIGACLKSVRAQNPSPVEVTVVVDGGDDATAENGAQVWPDRCVPSNAWGPAAARNAGVDQGWSDLLAFVDADDAVAPGWATVVVAAFEGGADIVDYAQLPADRDAGRVASSFLPSVPIVVIGATTGAVGREPPMAISVEDLIRDPSGTVHRLAPLLGLTTPERVATALSPLLLNRRQRMRTR